MLSSIIDQIFFGSCSEVLPNFPDESVDCVVTSPPYADQRKKLYDGIPEAEYPAWTVEYMKQVRRVLKPEGSVAIVIRPHLKDGHISDYVLRTRLALRDDGWYENDEFIWIKPNAPPMGHNQRPRRSWESILWFSSVTLPYCDAKANGVDSDRLGLESKKGVGTYVHTPGKAKSGVARSRDYVEVGTSQVNKDPDNDHPAQYPEEVAEWLIRMLCPLDGVVLDPFMGSGTTAVAALNTGRHYVGVEKKTDYEHIINKRIGQALAA